MCYWRDFFKQAEELGIEYKPVPTGYYHKIIEHPIWNTYTYVNLLTGEIKEVERVGDSLFIKEKIK